MTEAKAHAVYDVLVRECGASEVDRLFKPGRAEFVRAMSVAEPVEWRFCGALGPGGKLYPGRHGEPHRVGYYSEDDTPERRAMIDRANAALKEMVER
jgi:hypothetical protein